jgi:hypothetical protein
MLNFEDTNRKSKEAMDTVLKSYSDTAKGLQAIATEATEYSKKSFQDAVTHFETLSGARSFEDRLRTADRLCEIGIREFHGRGDQARRDVFRHRQERLQALRRTGCSRDQANQADIGGDVAAA